MKTKFIFFLLVFLATYHAQAQKHDKVWAVGPFISKMTFDDDSVRLSTFPDSFMNCFVTIGSMSDRNGNLLFVSNGVKVYNRLGQMMPNGDSLSAPSTYYDQVFEGGMPSRQGVVILPDPGDSDRYYIFHYTPMDTIHHLGGYEALNLYYSIVDMRLDGGMGDLSRKNVPIIQNEMLSFSRMAACKHANGRDWWIIKNAWRENIYYKFLLTPNGISGPFVQQIGPRYGVANEQGAYSLFTPDGSKYISFTSYSYIVLMDFDRCSGLLSKPDSVYNNNSVDPSHHRVSGGASAAISSNGRFLYVNNRLELNQYDLWSSSIHDSVRIKTLTDTGDFFQMDILQLAPDGKIYVSLWNGGTYFIHKINSPDSLGLACDFQMYSQPVLSINPVAIPYFPNYRLTALAGACDTLTALEDIIRDHPSFATVYPNPVTDHVTIGYYTGTGKSNFASITDVTGRVVWSKEISGNSGTLPIDVSQMTSGIYIVTFTSGDTQLINTKLVVAH